MCSPATQFARLRISKYRWWRCPCCNGAGTFFQRLLAEKHSALVRGAKLLLEKEVMSGADLKDIMAAH